MNIKAIAQIVSLLKQTTKNGSKKDYQQLEKMKLENVSKILYYNLTNLNLLFSSDPFGANNKDTKLMD